MSEWRRGMNVFLKIRGYGDSSVEIDYKRKFKIRSIGKKQAILDRIFTTEEEKRLFSMPGRKVMGRSYYLTDADQIRTWRENYSRQDLPSYMYEFWSDLFVPAGDDNWDPEENYIWS